MAEFYQKSESTPEEPARCGAAAAVSIPSSSAAALAPPPRDTYITKSVTKEREDRRFAMRITRHEKSYIVELSDSSVWRIWPADMTDTLQWLPTTEIDVKKIDDEICSHALINRSDGSQVRVIKANREWPLAESLRSLSH
jgi:hypothetical protein